MMHQRSIGNTARPRLRESAKLRRYLFRAVAVAFGRVLVGIVTEDDRIRSFLFFRPLARSDRADDRDVRPFAASETNDEVVAQTGRPNIINGRRQDNLGCVQQELSDFIAAPSRAIAGFLDELAQLCEVIHPGRREAARFAVTAGHGFL